MFRTDDMVGTNFAQMGGFGGGVAQFINPYGLTVDPTGTIYVADTHDGRIAQFDNMNADAWTAYGGCRIGTGQFGLPMGVSVLPLASRPRTPPSRIPS